MTELEKEKAIRDAIRKRVRIEALRDALHSMDLADIATWAKEHGADLDRVLIGSGAQALRQSRRLLSKR